MNTKTLIKSFFTTLGAALMVLALAFPGQPSLAVAKPPSPFMGSWQATDVDGSDMRLAIAGVPTGPFQITWTDSVISYCDGEAGILRGVGLINEGDPNLLEADLHLECFTTGTTLDFQLTLRYHPNTNTLSIFYFFGQVTIWHRPGPPQPPPPALNLRVNYGHDDWVESFYEADHTAWVTVTESDGVTVKATSVLLTEPKGYWEGEPGFQTLDSVWFDPEGNPMDSPPDIQPEDWVYGWVDNGARAAVQIGDIQGTIDLENDSISGTILAPWFSDPVPVECLDWGSGGVPINKTDGSILTNGTESYSCFWADEWNIQPGQTVGVGYLGPDGHWVANAFVVPTLNLRVNYGHDWVESFYEAGHAVSLQVTDSEGNVKATAEVFTEPKDFWDGQTGFQTAPENWSPAPPDLQPYDWVYAQVDNGATAQVQLGDIRGEVRFDLDSVTGTIVAPWITDSVQVECLDWGSGQEPPFENKDGGFRLTDGSDPYSCSWDPETEWDVQPWQDIGVGYFTPDGHWVANAFRDERWMAMWTFDLPANSWDEGEYSYYFEWAYTVPQPGDFKSMDTLPMTVASNAPIYPGKVLIQPWPLAPQLAWTGSACETVPSVNPGQPTRFVWGWVNDFSMTYEEALEHFNSFTVNVFWSGPTNGSASLARGELLPFTGLVDACWEYRCTLTEVWRQGNVSGFGEPGNIGVTALEEFNGRLYAGASNWNTGGQVWRLEGGNQWLPVSDVGFGGGPANPAIIDLAVFQGQLYAGVGWDESPGQIWRSLDGTTWEQVVGDGFDNAENIAVTNFVVFNDMLYAGTGSIVDSSAQIWRSSTGENGSWEQVAPDETGLAGNLTGFVVYNQVLYAAIESAGGLGAPLQVWRSTDGSEWTTVTAYGFDDPGNISTGGFASFDGYLYLGTRNDATGAQLWRSQDGMTWTQVIGDGFGDINNVKVESLFVFGGSLYVVTNNAVTGMEVWHSKDGSTWHQFNADGFGDSNNFATLWNNATVEYQGQIVIGTWNNASGGEVWVMLSTPPE